MPSRISADELEVILHVVGRYPEGAAPADLMAAPELNLTRRTLARRLQLLLEEGRLTPIGEGRARRYVLPERDAEVSEVATTVPTQVEDDWLSPEAKEIRDNITRSVNVRTPVSYQADFLESYVPNESAYLPSDLRQHLGRIGQVGLTNLPAGTYLRQILHRLLIDLSWNSSRLEGNTYSLLETERLLELGEAVEGKEAEEAQMILNHKAAIEMLAEQAEEIGFNRYTIFNLHALLSDNLLADPAAGGRLRRRGVGITCSVYHPLEVPQLIDEYFDKILEKASVIEDAFEQAFFLMVHLPYLQPFEDVNKRVSRLAANIALGKHNLCPLSFIDVRQEDYVGALLGVYELNRIEYLRDLFAWAYERSAARYTAVRQSLGDPDPFRLRYRAKIGSFVRDVVLNRFDKSVAARWIATEAGGQIPEEDRAKFVQVVEVELSSLHEGNIARYRLRPGEFNDWIRDWR
ncbi:MAG TPA: Fic family protein [Rhodothermales bacterium]|nr:Fic family protein [Rhodothermales bacterium]